MTSPQQLKKLNIYIDGASRGNPGPASYGVCIFNEEGHPIFEVGETLGIATNSIAEYRALIRALQEGKRLGCGELSIFTDSQLVARQFDGQYRIKNISIKELWAEIDPLLKEFTSVIVTHIPRSSHPGNVQADKLCNIALDRSLKIKR